MPKNVIITPASGKIDFLDASAAIDASITLEDSGNLKITNPAGDISLGDVTADIYVGDGVNNVDIVFEQNGEIRALTNKTLTLGQADSFVSIAAPVTNNTYFTGNVGIGLAPVTNNGILQLSSYGSIKALIETATISATAATGTINYDTATQAVLYYTSNASANWTLNFRGSSTLSLNSMMQTGQSLTVAFLVTQGATAYYNNAIQVDGASVTPKWQGGTAPSSGNASSIDVYSYTIVKTGSAAFTVFASQTKFA